MEKVETNVNESAYFKARYLFFNMVKGGHAEYDADEGLKVRAALATVVQRNPNTDKLFKTKHDKTKNTVRIWRKI